MSIIINNDYNLEKALYIVVLIERECIKVPRHSAKKATTGEACRKVNDLKIEGAYQIEIEKEGSFFDSW